MSSASRHLHMGCGEALTGRWLGALGSPAPNPWAGLTQPRGRQGTRRGRGQQGERRRGR